jgi:two-component system, NarL family, sensor histidine kinase DesK
MFLGPGSPPDRRLLKGAGRWRLFAGLWLVYLVPAFGQAWTDHTGVARWVRLLLLAAFCYVYADLVARALTRGPDWLRWASPAALFVLACVIAAVTGPDSLGIAVYVVVSAATLLSVRPALAASAVVVVLVAVLPEVIPSWRSSDSWSAAGGVVLGALAAFGFTALLRRTRELRDAQAEVSRLAAERERLRIARDLHDLLGHSLTTVAVKAALARRLVPRDPERAAAEMADVESLARQGLADVRAAVAGYREVSLAVELATAREVLAAAGMTATVPGAVDDVPSSLRELFAWTVREGVTNAVRHSRATAVTIAVTPTSVSITDDGVGSRPGPSGSGLAGLAERAARSAATLTAGPLPTTGYRLSVDTHPTPDPTPPGGDHLSGDTFSTQPSDADVDLPAGSAGSGGGVRP